MPPLSTPTARATHARPLHPVALASVPSGILLVQVRVRASSFFPGGRPARRALSVHEPRPKRATEVACARVKDDSLGVSRAFSQPCGPHKSGLALQRREKEDTSDRFLAQTSEARSERPTDPTACTRTKRAIDQTATEASGRRAVWSRSEHQGKERRPLSPAAGCLNFSPVT